MTIGIAWRKTKRGTRDRRRAGRRRGSGNVSKKKPRWGMKNEIGEKSHL
jgi:hypothetical protein